MKKLTLLTTILLFSLILIGQNNQKVLKIKTDAISFRINTDNKLDTNSWTSWTSWKVKKDLIVFSEQTVTLYSNEKIFTYDIVKAIGKTIDEDGDEVSEWIAIDNNGQQCLLKYGILHSKNNVEQFYFYTPKFRICYLLSE